MLLGTRLPGALLILLVAVGGCRRPEPEPDVSQQAAATPVEAFFRYGMVEIAATRAALAEALGTPDSTSFRTVTNAHDASVTDTIFTIHYPGLAVELYRATFDGRELIAAMHIADNRWLRPESPLQLGMTREQVRLALGEPERDEDGDLFYTCASCNLDGQDSLELLMERGTLQRIIVHYWLD